MQLIKEGQVTRSNKGNDPSQFLNPNKVDVEEDAQTIETPQSKQGHGILAVLKSLFYHGNSG